MVCNIEVEPTPWSPRSGSSEIPNNHSAWSYWGQNSDSWGTAFLEGSGTVSHQEAIEKAEREFEIYREREMRMLESDFDKAVKALLENNDNQKEG